MCVNWRDGGWDVGAYFVDDPFVWHARRSVFSRLSFDLNPSVTSPDSLEKRVAELEAFKAKVEKKFNEIHHIIRSSGITNGSRYVNWQ